MNTHIFPIQVLQIPEIRDLFRDDVREIVRIQVEEQNSLNAKPFIPPTIVAETRDDRRLERILEPNVLEILNRAIRTL